MYAYITTEGKRGWRGERHWQCWNTENREKVVVLVVFNVRGKGGNLREKNFFFWGGGGDCVVYFPANTTHEKPKLGRAHLFSRGFAFSYEVALSLSHLLIIVIDRLNFRHCWRLSCLSCRIPPLFSFFSPSLFLLFINSFFLFLVDSSWWKNQLQSPPEFNQYGVLAYGSWPFCPHEHRFVNPRDYSTLNSVNLNVD